MNRYQFICKDVDAHGAEWVYVMDTVTGEMVKSAVTVRGVSSPDKPVNLSNDMTVTHDAIATAPVQPKRQPKVPPAFLGGASVYNEPGSGKEPNVLTRS